MFLTRLPEESLVRTTPEIRRQIREAKDWSLEVELMAQLIEEVSILAADRRRKSPRTVPRPKSLKPPSQGVKGALAVLQATARTVHRAA